MRARSGWHPLRMALALLLALLLAGCASAARAPAPGAPGSFIAHPALHWHAVAYPMGVSMASAFVTVAPSDGEMA